MEKQKVNPKVAALEMAFRMRSSKFRHVYGSPTKKEMCYECIKITKNAHDSNFCAVNPRFVAIVTESAGGGAFLILPLEKVGRVDINAFKVCGHSGPVLDVKWNPFDDHVIASCSDDATIKLWQIPEQGLASNLTEWLVDLHGHQRRVGHIAWHPTAQSILLSAGYDHQCILWNTDTAEPVNIISVHQDTIFSISWNLDGSLFASTCKDKKLRIIDPRSGEVINEGQGHAGSKSSKVVFLGDKNRLFTTGFSRLSERQYAVWDAKNLSRPLAIDVIDASSGVLFPFYDPDTSTVYVAGKGDGNIRYFELVNDHPYCHYLSQYQSSSPQRGLGMMPKRGIDPSRCEIVRFYKLHAVKGVCEPVSMIVPRKSEMFQEDIFPPTASACPSLTADEWIAGQDRQPILISLKDGNVVSVPKSSVTKAVQRKLRPPPPDDRPSLGRSLSNSSATSSTGGSNSKSLKARVPPSGGRISKKDQTRKDLKKDSPRKDQAKKDGAISNSPVITTYKAVKRGVAAVSSNAPSERGSKRQSTAPPTATVAPSQGRLPPSIQNIRKMTSVEDSDRENENEEFDSNDNNNSVNDRISSFEKKTGVNVTKSVMRMTNSNQPLRVERKIWSSTYTGVNANQSPPPSNGMPRTDPERDTSCESYENADTYVSTTATQCEEPPTSPAKQRLCSEALEQAEQELYANLHIQTTPHSEQQRRAERKRSRISDSGSEQFSTPPTSPLSRQLLKGSSDNSFLCDSPNRSADQSVFIQQSPTSWTTNPLYNTSSPSPQQDRDFQRSSRLPARVRTPPRESESTARVSSPQQEFTPGAPQRSSFRSSFRRYRDTEPNNNKIPVTSSKVISNGTGHVEENNNITKPTGGQNGDEEPAYIELEGGFPVDAPDHTLIKPSKLRASLRGRRRHTNTGVSSDIPEVSNRREECMSPPPRLSQRSNDQGYRRNVVVIENKSRSRSSIASCTAQEKIPYPSSQIVSQCYGTVSPEPADQPLLFDKLNANTSDALIKPSRMRDSFRRQRSNPKSLDNENNTDQVRTLRPASPDPSPTSPPPDLNVAIPLNDNELRKAYFRQVEEMSSLKEQIGLKDKRIRQLEEEVRLLRDGRHLVGESMC